MRLSSIVTAAACLAFGVVAHADTFYFNLSGPSVAGSGIFTASPTSTTGEFLITGITGTFDGAAITSLLPIGSYPPAFPPENDNLFYNPGTPGFLDLEGVSFTTAAAIDVNIFFGYMTSPTGVITGPFYFVIDNPDYITTLTSFNAGTTPEPSSILLFGTGLLGLAGAARRRITSRL